MNKKKLKEDILDIYCPKCKKKLKRLSPYTYGCDCMPDMRLAHL